MSHTPDIDLQIPTLGERTVLSPLSLSTQPDDCIADFTRAKARVLYDRTPTQPDQLSFELAGPRKYNFFENTKVVAGIVTCGGLCPGLNNVVRDLVLTLWHLYEVRHIFGFRYGFRGIAPHSPDPPVLLDPAYVRTIHHEGGTVLGSSRGPQDVPAMVDNLERLGVNALFVVGGDGGMRGATALFDEITRRNLPVAVVGVPKTIDNDLPYIERTFGFETAVTVACQAIRAATIEATGAPRGVGLVRLMGRNAGFIAASSVLASREADLVLVPELAFELQGAGGLFAWLRGHLAESGSAVIVVAEGAGQTLFPEHELKDASGNSQLGDIGVFLRDAIKKEFAKEELNLKYIDPSYLIRAAPANPGDTLFCGRLAEDAVHAAMAGKTGLVVGLWMNRFTYVPLHTVTSTTKRIDLDSMFWRSVVDCTGQPPLLR
ncbi:MAG: diphosphate--fructose-6-phosphate 1-phosphotransferase [Deltaproteobacteria bacterium CG_4_9_14_3_um_filter_63_12]|nr:MAG: diphosphate--fructose-6-phosphate 1-phosphotransferase [Deltaproteobacteria bacterium CG_4_9_14_3_um_filter_63_12]